MPENSVAKIRDTVASKCINGKYFWVQDYTHNSICISTAHSIFTPGNFVTATTSDAEYEKIWEEDKLYLQSLFQDKITELPKEMKD